MGSHPPWNRHNFRADLRQFQPATRNVGRGHCNVRDERQRINQTAVRLGVDPHAEIIFPGRHATDAETAISRQLDEQYRSVLR